MKISNNYNTNPFLSFRAIELSESEFLQVEHTLKRYIDHPEEKSFNEQELFKIMSKHLQNEVEIKSFNSTSLEKRNFVVALYLKFFQNIKAIFQSKNNSVSVLIDDLNHFSSHYMPRIADRREIPNYDIYAVHKDATKMKEYLSIDGDKFIQITKSLPILQYKIFEDVENNIAEFSKELKFEKSEVLNLIKSNPKILLNDINVLKKKALFIMEYLNIETLDELKICLVKHPHLLTTDNIVQKVDELAVFLKTDEETIKSMVKNYVPIFDPKHNRYYKTNFEVMKDFLNVDRAKMIELSLQSPMLILNDPNFMKKIYEDSAKILGVSIEKFYQHAKEEASMFKITPNSLNQIINFMISEYKFTQKEAKEYIKSNLYMLKFHNKKSFKEQNQRTFEILNRKLNIDYKTYISILKGNPMIITYGSDRLIKRIDDGSNYFELDKESYLKYLKINPMLLSFSSSKTDKEIEDNIENFKLSKEQLKQIYLKDPNLLSRRFGDLNSYLKTIN